MPYTGTTLAGLALLLCSARIANALAVNDEDGEAEARAAEAVAAAVTARCRNGRSRLSLVAGAILMVVKSREGVGPLAGSGNRLSEDWLRIPADECT